MVKDNVTSSEKEFIELTKSEKKEIKQEVKEILKNTESTDTISQKQKPSMEDKISNFFDTIEFLELENEEKESVATQIKQQIQSDKLYWIEIFLSSVIATL
jgi:predicted RNA-binding protein (virulence factor B family)